MGREVWEGRNTSGRGSRKKHEKEHRELIASPCGRPPTTPSGLVGVFDVRHKHRHSLIRVKLRWDEVTTDTSGFTIGLHHYDVELDFSTDGGDTWESELSESGVERHTVPAKDDDDDDEKAHYVIRGVRKKHFYRWRVRAVHTDSCASAWSDYDVLGYPDDVFPDTPANVTAFQKARDRLVVDWDPSLDVDDHELVGEEAAYYQVVVIRERTDGEILRAAYTASGATNTFTSTAHGLNDGDDVHILGAGAPTPTDPHTRYFVRDAAADTFKITDTEGGSALNLTSDGEGTFFNFYRFDRYVHKTRHSFKVRKADEDDEFYSWVRAVNSEGLKSDWIGATEAGNSLTGVDPDPINVGPRKLMATWSRMGGLRVRQGKHRYHADEDMKLKKVHISVGTAPVGATLIVDVNINGTTIFTDQTKRPRIVSGDFADTAWRDDIDVVDFNDGDYMTVDVDQVGSTIAGEDLVVQVFHR